MATDTQSNEMVIALLTKLTQQNAEMIDMLCTIGKKTFTKLTAARTAVSVCGAEVKPDSSGAGYEAEISMAQAH